MKMQPLVHRILVLSSCLALFACQKDISRSDPMPGLTSAASKASADQVNTFKGPEVQMGMGKARSWISVNHDGVPQEIGFEMTSGALQGLPTNPMDFAHEEWVLPLHQKAQALTAFDHLVINWNPQGHEPQGVFTVPHFDFHFYMISLQEQLAIKPTDPFIPPPAGYIPDGYVTDGSIVPQMGTHWLDPRELAHAFTDIMIYGSYAGKVTFEEPMITLQELTTHSDHVPYAQPRLYQEHGVWYPTQYNYYQEGGKYYVSLSKFVWNP